MKDGDLDIKMPSAALSPLILFELCEDKISYLSFSASQMRSFAMA